MILEQVAGAAMWPGSLRMARGLDVSACKGKLVDVLVFESTVNSGVWSSKQIKLSSTRTISAAHRLVPSVSKARGFVGQGIRAGVARRHCTGLIGLWLWESLRWAGWSITPGGHCIGLANLKITGSQSSAGEKDSLVFKRGILSCWLLGSLSWLVCYAGCCDAGQAGS